MNKANASIMSDNALDWTTTTFEKINNWVKGFGIIAGGLFASLADWVTGSIALSVLFGGVSFPGILTPFMVGSIWSLGSWGIQLLLWEVVLSGNFWNVFKTKGNFGQKTAFIGAILLKLCDDAIDLLAIFYMLQNNQIQALVSPSIYTVVVGVVFLLSWILVGFSEIFVSISIYMLRDSSFTYGHSKKNKYPTPQPSLYDDDNYSPKPKYKAPNRYKQDIISRLPQQK